MSLGSSGGGADFYTAGGFNGRSTGMGNPQGSYRSQLPGILSDSASQIVQRRPDLIGKRSPAEFQSQQQVQHPLYQQQQALGFYLRNVKQRAYQHAFPMDLSAAISPDVSSISSGSSGSSSPAMSSRYGVSILQQLRPQPVILANGNGVIPPRIPNLPGVSYAELLANRVSKKEPAQESEKKMMNQLHELEKQLLDDNDDEEGDAVSVVTNSEWSETIQNLINPAQLPPSLSPTSSSSSCSSSASPPIVCPKQSLMEAASALSEGKTEVVSETITRLNQVANVRGTSEQRLTAYMASALRSRVSPMEYPPPVAELYSKEHAVSTQMLYEVSPCFKLGFMAANLAILDATSEQHPNKLHVVDFDIGQGGQYMHLIHALAARKTDKSAFLRITTFADFANGGEERSKAVGDALKTLANKVGVCLNFNVLCLKTTDLSLETLAAEASEALAVNFAFRLYKLPDESVTTENLRDELLRRVKSLSPKVVTVVEQEMNANTATFVARVTEACGYYGALFDSLEATMGRDNPDRVRIEEGLGRKAANSVACEGRDRVERCEVFGKWRARMTMAGFEPKPMGPQVADSLRTRLNSRGNPGFTVKEESGGICFGWMGRTLTVASSWRSLPRLTK